MRTKEVTQEFRDRCKELATRTKLPEVKQRLEKLALRYERHLAELDSPPLSPQ